MRYYLAGKTFGRLAVIALGSRTTTKHSYWLCRCTCGVEKQVRSDALTSGVTRSCGCWHRQVTLRGGIHHQPGTHFGRLTVIRSAGVRGKLGRYFVCRCKCGKRVTVRGRQLREGTTKSCGCWYTATRATANYRHGQGAAGRRRNPVYSAFFRERSWCRNPNDPQYWRYGGRGIRFLFSSFPEFYTEVGDKPGQYHALQRIDGGDFAPGNLHWVAVTPPRNKRKR